MRLPVQSRTATVSPMQKRQRIPKLDRLREAIDEIGGEPLEGSGFEDETPDEDFAGAAPLPSNSSHA